MIQLGKEQTLEVLRITSIGAYLGEGIDPLAIFARTEVTNTSAMTDKTDILLPNNELSKQPAVGDKLRVFVYLDSEDRPVATLKTPALTIGGLAALKVRDVANIGAFLDWGLPKDLFLPFREQTKKVEVGDRVLVTLYTDRSKRLCATMKLYKHLRTDSDHIAGDHVTGMVYEVSDSFGAYVAVDNLFSGMIPKKELMRNVSVGDELNLRISRVLGDGKLELSMREPEHIQIDTDSDIILAALKASAEGTIPFGDKSDSEAIRARFGMSKNSFKKALGHLMKLGLVTIGDDSVSLK